MEGEDILKRITLFFFEAGMLKRLRRTGYHFLGTGKESVAEHCFRTALIGYGLASLAEVDIPKVVFMCLFHDLPEARTGDQNYMNKKYVKADEERALRDQLKGVPFGEEIERLLSEFRDAHSPEAMLARDADQLDLIFELKVQLDLGNHQARDWIYYAQKRLRTPEAISIAKKVLETDWTEWWFDKGSLWWVNGPEGNESP